MKFTSLAALCLVIFTLSCKKNNSSGGGVSLSPFAQSLRSACTSPFVGKGDSVNIFFPTAFSPNGDGVDDYYGPLLNAYSFSTFSVKIYDTTGILVYQATKASNRMWDGTDMTTNKQSKKYKFYVKINYTTTGNVTDSGSTYLFLLAGDSTRNCVEIVPADTSKYEFTDQFTMTGFVPGYTSDEFYCH